MIVKLTNNAGITTIKQLKAVLDKYPENWTVSICGLSDVGIFIDHRNNNLLIDDYYWFKDEIEK